jgi:hypothetical protein
MRNWGSHAHPISLPATARRVRSGKGGQIAPVFRLRSPRGARKRFWGSPLRAGPGIPGSHKVMQCADKRTSQPRNPPTGTPPARSLPSAAFEPWRNLCESPLWASGDGRCAVLSRSSQAPPPAGPRAAKAHHGRGLEDGFRLRVVRSRNAAAAASAVSSPAISRRRVCQVRGPDLTPPPAGP